jgi:hypothetical protein
MRFNPTQEDSKLTLNWVFEKCRFLSNFGGGQNSGSQNSGGSNLGGVQKVAFWGVQEKGPFLGGGLKTWKKGVFFVHFSRTNENRLTIRRVLFRVFLIRDPPPGNPLFWAFLTFFASRGAHPLPRYIY